MSQSIIIKVAIYEKRIFKNMINSGEHDTGLSMSTLKKKFMRQD